MISEQKHLALCDEFMLCLDEQRFYDAHEALEEIWFPRRFDDDGEVKLLKGFINASVSFELAKKGKVSASNKVWKNYLKYRQLFYKVDSKYLNKYNSILRSIDRTRSCKPYLE